MPGGAAAWGKQTNSPRCLNTQTTPKSSAAVPPAPQTTTSNQLGTGQDGLPESGHLGKVAKHAADVRALGIVRKSQSRTPQKTQKGSRNQGADVCGRLVFQQWPKTEAARTYRGYAQIAPDVRPAITELQRF